MHDRPPNLGKPLKPSKDPNFFQKFSTHPASVGENYWEHFFFAARFSLRLSTAGSAALIHAPIPAWFETTASRQVSLIHYELMSRNSDAGEN